MQINVNTINQLSEAAKRLLAFFEGEKVFLFFGDMGAGKTSLIKAICQEVGVVEAVSSPTYAIVN